MSTPIMGDVSIDWNVAAAWATSRGAPWTWAAQAEMCWLAALHTGVRPEVMWAQACKETGFGKYGRAVTPEHRNPCGLKIPDPSGLADNDSRAHFRFDSWYLGWLGFAQHLALYAGAAGYPLPYKKVSAVEFQGVTADPRHFAFILGAAVNAEDLGGEDPPDGIPDWAPSPDYGFSIVRDFLNPLLAFIWS